MAQLIVERVPFLYGDGEKAETLYADMPLWSCQACGERYSAEGAEEAERMAICAHLGRYTPAEIRKIRREAGLTQEEFARELKVGRVSVARWESGQQLQSAVYDGLIRAWSANRVTRPVFRVRQSAARFRTNVDHRRAAAHAFSLVVAA